MRRQAAAAGALCCALAMAVVLPGCSSRPRIAAAASDTPFVLKGVTNVEQIGQVTGAESPGQTDQYAVNHTDLGSMFEKDGKVWFVFGDTFGERESGVTGGGGSFWRSNTMAWTSDDDPSDGIALEGMVLDETATAAELLPSKKIDGDEMTVIPTHGFAVGDTMYLHYMSVRHWGEPGEWDVNYAGLASSTDDGASWSPVDGIRWAGDSNFVQISPYSVREGGTDWLYVWGITHGRFGGVALAKVTASDIEDPAAWQYLTGIDSGEPTWAPDAAAATTVVDDTVGELSVVWNDYLDRWIMTYLAEGRGIVMREGITPWGPWGEPVEVIAQDEVAGPYAPFMLDRYTEDGGRVIYFTLSIWDPYNVFWYRAELQKH